jgi:EAL domain-containing protein (putative c-di-GMP-specific phosphodiesterase class I)
MAKGLGLSSVAEGVETQEQAEALAVMGCTYAQGYLYSKPLPADEFLRLL